MYLVSMFGIIIVPLFSTCLLSFFRQKCHSLWHYLPLPELSQCLLCVPVLLELTCIPEVTATNPNLFKKLLKHSRFNTIFTIRLFCAIGFAVSIFLPLCYCLALLGVSVYVSARFMSMCGCNTDVLCACFEPKVLCDNI